MVELREPPRATAPSNTPVVKLLVALQVVTLGAISFLFFGSQDDSGPTVTRAEHVRAIASKLKAAGANDEASSLYEQYLNDLGSESAVRAQIAYSLGKSYLAQGQYGRSLRWLYEAETLGAGKLAREVGQKIVHCLERLGRVHAAQAALAARASLNPEAVARAGTDPVVAEIGLEKIYGSDVMRSLDDLPSDLQNQFGGADALPRYLKKYIADELMWRKAKKLEYDKDPMVQRQLENLLKHLVVNRFMQEEVWKKVKTDPADLKNFYEANKKKYGDGDFKKNRAAVERDYRVSKVQGAAGKIISDEFELAGVKLYPERLKR